MADDIDFRAMMLRTGVRMPDDQPAPAASERVTCDSLSLTIGKVRFALRLGVEPTRYAASKSIRTLAAFKAAMRRRRAEGTRLAPRAGAPRGAHPAPGSRFHLWTIANARDIRQGEHLGLEETAVTAGVRRCGSTPLSA